MLFTCVFQGRFFALRWVVALALSMTGMAVMAEKTTPRAAATPPVSETQQTPAAKSATTDVLSNKRINPRSPAAPATSAAVLPMTQDPLERLQEKLAARLGARMAAAEAKDGSELRVVARSAADSTVVKSAPSVKTMARAGTAAGSTSATAAVTKTNGVASVLPAQVWSYDGASGPQAWAQLKPEYAACGTGDRQSPIDVRDGIKVQLDAVQFSYQAPDFRVIDDGRTVRVLVAAGSSMEVRGQRYELKHLQFHRPSEVHLNGKAFDMAVHLVHQDAEGRAAILVVQLERGSAHSVVQAVWNNLPLEKGVEQAARSPLDLLALLPADQRYATFMGSMTAPPCQEGVLWVVMKQPVGVSDYQIEVFSRLYPMNARPLQAVNGRMVKESE
ncbi:MAG: carbonic anhydrase family protein [Rhizobacter sp.]